MLILSEYYWNSVTECGEFVYEDEEGNPHTATKSQPLKAEPPTLEAYFEELKWFLSTQGAF